MAPSPLQNRVPLMGPNIFTPLCLRHGRHVGDAAAPDAGSGAVARGAASAMPAITGGNIGEACVRRDAANGEQPRDR